MRFVALSTSYQKQLLLSGPHGLRGNPYPYAPASRDASASQLHSHAARGNEEKAALGSLGYDLFNNGAHQDHTGKTRHQFRLADL